MNSKSSDTATASSTNFMARVVPWNKKCHGCLHYETNKSVCLTALMPSSCGDGSEPHLGYAPLAQLKPGTPGAGPTVGAAQVVAGHDKTANNTSLGATPIEFLGDEAPQLAAVLSSAAQAHMAKSASNCSVHAIGPTSGTVNRSLASLVKGGSCGCDKPFNPRVVHELYANLSPRFRFAYSEEAVVALLGSAFDDLMEKSSRGPGSRGGRIAYYTKTGKPVYTSKVQHMAAQAHKVMHNWHHNAKHSKHGEDHALASKHGHVAAFLHHHNGNSEASHAAMEIAHEHMQKLKKLKHRSKTTKWVDEHHDKIKQMVGWHSPEDDEHINPHERNWRRKIGSPVLHQPTHKRGQEATVHRSMSREKVDALLAKAERTPKEIDALNKAMYGEDWLSQFQDTPFFDHAVALCERDLALDEMRLKKREKEAATPKPAPAEDGYDKLWLKRDRIAHEKRKLELKLARHRQDNAKKRAKAYKQADSIKSEVRTFADLFKGDELRKDWYHPSGQKPIRADDPPPSPRPPPPNQPKTAQAPVAGKSKKKAKKSFAELFSKGRGNKKAGKARTKTGDGDTIGGVAPTPPPQPPKPTPNMPPSPNSGPYKPVLPGELARH
jgi:hypothetical protein